MRAILRPLVLASTVTLTLTACGRNGPLPPWPTFDLAGAPPSGKPDDMGTPPPPPVRTWEWVNPGATSNALRAVGGTSGTDVWLVGDVGTLLHWDGARVTEARAGAAAESFTAVAAVAPNDVWIAGRASSGSILHWDGSIWSSAYAIANQTIHALTASSNGHVYATVEKSGVGEIWTRDALGGWYSLEYWQNTTPILRDVFALPYPGSTTGADMLFAVGDKGAVLWGSISNFKPGTPSGGGISDPFSSDKNYFGVWGASASDVWAVFMSGTTLGFSHFNGQAWTVAQTLPIGCFYGGPVNDLPVDRGKRLVGLDATHILAALGPSFYCSPFEWNGTTWAERPITNRALQQPSFAGIADRWYAVTVDGAFRISNSDESWTDLPAPSRRDDFQHLSVSDDGTWSTLGLITSTPAVQPRVWTTSGWQISTTPAVSDGTQCLDVWALSANDVWLTGMRVKGPVSGDEGIVMHWDGSAWSTPIALPSSHELTSVWADSDNDVWVAGRGDPSDEYGESCVVYRYDGTSWRSVPVPPHPIGVSQPAIGGLGPNAVWITSFLTNDQALDRRAVWKWDGTSIQQVAWVPNGWAAYGWEPFGHPWATSESDVWIAGQPVMHWDGNSWSTSASPPFDIVINAIYGTSRDDVWAVGTGPFGGAIWHLEKGRFISVLDVSPRLFGISGSKHMLPWIVGQNGATLRLVEHAPTP
jgi:predicted small lipoprotein YifL